MDYKKLISKIKGHYFDLTVQDSLSEEQLGKLRKDLWDMETAMTDLLARAEAAEASAEKYKSFFDDVAEKPNCNTCADQKCTYRPNPGEITRFNCPLWRGQKEKIEVRFFDESSKFTEEQWEFIKKRFLKAE